MNMTINYTGTFKATICFNDSLVYHGMEDKYYPLQQYVNMATWLIEKYCFPCTAYITDSETGEILVEIKNNDFPNDYE